MTDRAIADQLKALADDCQRRAEKLHMLMRPKRWLARPALNAHLILKRADA